MEPARASDFPHQQKTHYAPARDVTPGRGSSPSLLTVRPRLSSAPLALGHPGRAEVKIYNNEKTVYCQ
jgi:hypothetical protein